MNTLNPPCLNPIDSHVYRLIEECFKTHPRHIELLPATPDNPWWIGVYALPKRYPIQGWKLHISATILSIDTILDRVIPILIREHVSFKVIASREKLEELNRGEAGLSQIGKCITIYPHDDQQAVLLAHFIDAATNGCDGPAILSDRPLTQSSSVYYRYGSFRDQSFHAHSGVVLKGIRNSDNHLISDIRGVLYQKPIWVDDPFVAAGIATPDCPPSPLVGTDYLLLSIIKHSVHGFIARALKLQNQQICVIKQARRHVATRYDGTDARDLLKSEAHALRTFDAYPHFPTVFDYIEEHDAHYLVMEEIQGETLQSYCIRHASTGHTIPESLIRDWGSQLAALLEKLHRHQYSYRDLKAVNTMVLPDMSLTLIDFGLVCQLGEKDTHIGGTRGSISPQQAIGIHDTRNDIFSLGAVLYYLATHADPALAPRGFSLPDRPIRVLNPLISKGLEDIILRCLDPDPCERYQTMTEVQTALLTRTPVEQNGADQPIRQAHSLSYQEWVEALAETLIGTPPYLPNLDIYQGCSGIVLALVALNQMYPSEPYHQALQRWSAWIDQSKEAWMDEHPSLGLFTGQAGIGVALLQAGKQLNNTNWIKAAQTIGGSIGQQPYLSPDLMGGAAGRLRFHLMLWYETRERLHLEYALQAGFALEAMAQTEENGISWIIPPDADQTTGQSHILGYAHGAAGIGDALLDLFIETKEPRFLTLVQGSARWLMDQSLPALDDGQGLTWPRITGENGIAPCWAYGAAGIGRFFLHCAQQNSIPDALAWAHGAARTAAYSGRWLNPTRAHGLVGILEFLLTMAHATHHRAYLMAARDIGSLLQGWMIKQDERWVCSALNPKQVEPGLMEGYSGALVGFLRLLNPQHPWWSWV